MNETILKHLQNAEDCYGKKTMELNEETLSRKCGSAPLCILHPSTTTSTSSLAHQLANWANNIYKTRVSAHICMWVWVIVHQISGKVDMYV